MGAEKAPFSDTVVVTCFLESFKQNPASEKMRGLSALWGVLSRKPQSRFCRVEIEAYVPLDRSVNNFYNSCSVRAISSS